MYYIGTKIKCNQYNEQVTQGEGYVGDVTVKWDSLRKHPNQDLYAIIKHKNYESDMNLIETLSEDWIQQ